MSDARGLMFSTVSSSGTPTTKFDLSHEHKTTLNGGSITPILFQECCPGEIHDLDVRSFIRLMPMTFPIFQRIDLYVHAFFVPNRILWSGWNDFIWNGNGKVTMTDQSSWTPPVKPSFSAHDLYLLVYEACRAFVNIDTSPFKGSVSKQATAALLTAYVLTGQKRFLYNRFFAQNWVNLVDPVYQPLKSDDLTKFISYLLNIDVPSLSSLPVYLGYRVNVNEYVLGRFVYNTPAWSNDGTSYGSKMSQYNKIADDLASIAYTSTDLVAWINNLMGSTLTTLFSTQQNTDFNRTDLFDYSSILSGGKKSVSDVPLTEAGLDAALLAYAVMISSDQTPIDLLPFRAYLSIYDEYYRDENIDSFIDVPLNGGIVTAPDQDNWNTHFLRHCLFCKPRAWQHDYFTSCFPAQSRNNVMIPVNVKLQTIGSNGQLGPITAAVTSDESDLKLKSESNGNVGVYQHTATDDKVGELSAKTTSLMDDLRTAMHLQRMWDKLTRAGSRVRESLRNFFPHAQAQDLSPDEPVYLGGSSIPVTISEVTQTSASDANSALGDMAGHGNVTGSSDHIHLETHEHGFFCVFVSIRPRSGYSQGVSKMFSRWTYLDYPWPDLATLGEQKVDERELYNQPNLNGNGNVNYKTFGYIPRYSEFKYLNDTISGDFLNSSFDDWHLSRLFNRAPLLNSEFIHVGNTECDRVFAYQDHDYDHFVGAFYLDYQAVRPLPMYSDPTF